MFFERLQILCTEKNTDVTNLLKILGLSTSKGTSWRTGSIPKGDTLLKISEHFNVSTDYLLGKSNIRTSNSVEISNEDIKFALFNGTDEITDEMYDEVKRFAQFIKEREKLKGE